MVQFADAAACLAHRSRNSGGRIWGCTRRTRCSVSNGSAPTTDTSCRILCVRLSPRPSDLWGGRWCRPAEVARWSSWTSHLLRQLPVRIPWVGRWVVPLPRLFLGQLRTCFWPPKPSEWNPQTQPPSAPVPLPSSSGFSRGVFPPRSTLPTPPPSPHTTTPTDRNSPAALPSKTGCQSTPKP